MPAKDGKIRRDVKPSRRSTDQVGKQREIRVMLEELGAKRVQVGISSFLDPGYVDFGIVHAEVVAVDENGRPRQRSQAGGSF